MKVLGKLLNTHFLSHQMLEEDCFLLLEFLQEKMSYLQLRHPELYEEHLAEFLPNDNVIEAQK